MSVVIHDFEIIPDTPDDDGADDPPSSDADSASASIRPADVVRIVNRDERRRCRLRAH